MTERPSRMIVVMGVSGCGKSTVGAALAERIDCPFLDGDGYHPPANKEKMRAGTPLTDDDRWPWLQTLARAVRAAADEHGCAVSACSALKRSYRDFITTEAGEPVTFVHLSGSKELILSRMNTRQHEYMPASLLDSQFATLEPLQPDENAIEIDIEPPVDVIVDKTLARLGRT